MTRFIIGTLMLGLCVAFSRPASAVWITIPDASQVAYMTDGNGKVYFRNLDSFDSANALSCCYNYWIDTTSAEGKLIYALLLSYIPQAKGFHIWIPDVRQPGQMSAAGTW